jgi:hypothetical protein
MKRVALLSLGLAAVAFSFASCTKKDSLVLLDLRTSGPLGAPNVSVRLSAKGWPTRMVAGTIGLTGLHVGYYGPGDGSAVGVVAEALDGAGCVLGSGSTSVPALKAGATSEPTKLFVRALPDNHCVDAGMPGVDAGEDAGMDAGDDAGDDAGKDAEMDAGADAEVDAGMDAGADAEGDAAVDVGDDRGGDAATPDAVAD